MSTETVQLEVRQDCQLVCIETVNKRLIEITISASDVPYTSERIPLNLAVVIDRSGSMCGSKLEYLKQAACYVLDCLQERDQISIFAFDHEVKCISECTTISAKARAELKARIKALQAGGNTNLFDGWLHGVNEVAIHPMPQGIQRCLLLTDGQANHGEIRQVELERHAGELRMRGVATSTFGVAPDFNQFLLEGMATNGGGHYYFIEHPSAIPTLFQQELGELLTVNARRTVLKITAPSGASLNLLGDIPHDQLGREIIVPLGDLFAGSERVICFETLLPSDKTGTANYGIDLSYFGTTEVASNVSADAIFTYASEAVVNTAPQDWPMRTRAVELEVATVEARALRMAEDGRSEEAAASLVATIDCNVDFMLYSRVTDLRELASKLELNELSVMESKSRHDIAYKRRYSRENK